MKVRMDDGTEIEGGPGDTAVIPPGHDAWVVGNEHAVITCDDNISNILCHEHRNGFIEMISWTIIQ